MFQQIIKIFPEAILSEYPKSMTGIIWFKHDTSFIGIPEGQLTEKEYKILHTLFPFEQETEPTALPSAAQAWRNFLLDAGELPDTKQDDCRFIHFSITELQEEWQFDEWEEAVKGLFSGEVIIVPFSQTQGVIIEDLKTFALPEEDLDSAVEAFESDFFFKIHFFIGHFHTMDASLLPLFRFEQELFKLGRKEMPGDRIFTRENVFPIYIKKSLPRADKRTIFQDIHQLLIEDPDLHATVTAYIENQSNATLTAKKLFMHRNSLQYRIDKFIEKTGVDIKTFHGAFFAYFACLSIDEE